MNQSLLHTKRLILQPARSSDVNVLQFLWSQPEVRRFLFDDQEVSYELAERVLSSALECAPNGYGMWLVYLQNQTELLGCVGLMPATTAAEYEPALDGLLEPLAAFSAVHWHKGYAGESLTKVLDYAFNSLDQSRLCAVNDVPNKASERMLKKLGFDALSEVQGPIDRLRTYQLQRDSWVTLTSN